MDKRKSGCTHNVRCLVCSLEQRRNPNMTFHRLPERTERRDLWLRAVNKSELINKFISQDLRICQKHFDKTQISPYSKYLKRDAVPNVPGVHLNKVIDVEEQDADPVNLNKVADVQEHASVEALDKRSKHNVRCLVCSLEQRRNPKMAFHRLPERTERRDLWLRAINKSELINNNISQDLRICQKHFDKTQISPYSKRLKKDAVPNDPVNLNKVVDVQGQVEVPMNLNKVVVQEQVADPVNLNKVVDVQERVAVSMHLNRVVNVKEHAILKEKCISLRKQVDYLQSIEFFLQRCWQLLPPPLAQIAENHVRHCGAGRSGISILMSPAKVTVVGVRATK